MTYQLSELIDSYRRARREWFDSLDWRRGGAVATAANRMTEQAERWRRLLGADSFWTHAKRPGDWVDRYGDP